MFCPSLTHRNGDQKKVGVCVCVRVRGVPPWRIGGKQTKRQSREQGDAFAKIETAGGPAWKTSVRNGVPGLRGLQTPGEIPLFHPVMG